MSKQLPKPQEGPQTLFVSQPPEIPLIFYGGAAGGGKSWSLLAYLLRFVDCPHFYAVCFRKSLKQLERALFREAKELYRPLITDSNGKYIGKAKINDSAGNYKVTFPSGAVIEFSYLTCEKDAIDNFQGAELTAAIYDEFTHFDEASFNYIRTRMRSKSKYPSFTRCSMNPHPNHFVKSKYVEPFLVSDPNNPLYGVIDKNLNGKLRYYLFDRGQIVSSWDKSYLENEYPNRAIRSYTVIGSSLTDNKKMLEINSDYADDLEANDPANAAMLLDGNWNYQPAANGFWDRKTIQEISSKELPNGIVWCRAYDKASTEPSKENSSYDPDYTASCKVGKDRDGNLYYAGDYICDEFGEDLMRFRKKPGPRDELIRKQAEYDTPNVTIIFAKDPAQAGAYEFEQSAKKLQQEGFIVKADPMPSNKSKYKRFEPFCAASHNGYVYFVADTFSRKDLDYIYLELENFDGDKNNGYKDDVLDAISSGTSYILRERTIKPFSLPDCSTVTTAYTKHKSSIQ